jgi:hypothetical protein
MHLTRVPFEDTGRLVHATEALQMVDQTFSDLQACAVASSAKLGIGLVVKCVALAKASMEAIQFIGRTLPVEG